MTSLLDWFKQWTSRDNRKAERYQWPPLVAHYWTGGAPAAQRIRDISSSGFYLLTDTRWYPGTVVKITLQSTEETQPNADQCETDERFNGTISVQSRVVRRDADGVGLEFVLSGGMDPRLDPGRKDIVSDQQTLNRFLEHLLTHNSQITFKVE